MSLFTFKELWTVECSDEHNAFTSGSIVSANFDNSPDPGSVKFAVGSLTGILRIIGHISYEDINDTVACVLAEINLGHPILQIEADVFIGGSDDINLAILHPFKLSVYAISQIVGQVEHGSQYKISLLYEHPLKRHAFNMCCGPFGHGPTDNVKIKDRPTKTPRRFICVQSLDGTLSFFEQELFTFCRYLPGFLLPGQLAYVPTWDAFITVTSWNLVCFKYTSLAMSKDDPYQQQSQDTSVGKRLSPDWSFTIGEECIGDIQVLCTNDPATTCIIVSTFRNIMCFGDGGILIWAKRLDFQISYFHSFLVPLSHGEHECITIAASSNEPYNCYVYGGTMLRWAAKMPFPSIYLSRVFNYKGLNGGILTMNGNGTVVLGILGTVPSLFVAPPVQARDLDYEAAEQELNDLRKAISAAGEQEVSANKDGSVEIKLEFEGQKTKWMESNGLEIMSLIGVVKLICHLKVNDVRVTFNTSKPIICSPDSVFIGDIIGRHSYPVEFYVESETIPSDLQCDVFVFYINDNGSPHFVQKCGIRIPLFIVAKPHHKLEKDGNAKLTFSINKPVVNLLSLYNDFEWSVDGTAPGLSFMLHCGEIVSLLSSTKNASSETSKYRIQSQTLAGIYVIFRDFVDRIQRKLGKDKTELVVEPLGLDDEMSLLTDYFQEIDAHAVQRQRDAQIKDEISNRAAALRAVQRRLLIRFRDKNPLPLTQLEILFDGSLEQVGDCLNFIEGNDLEMQKTECRLSGATKLLLEVIKLKHKNAESVSLLLNALSPDVWNFPSEESGWEESVLTSLTFIRGGVVVNQSLANMDLSKLKRAIKSAVEKAWKEGFRPKTESVNDRPKSAASQPEKLVGNEIQERMTSARVRTSRRMGPTLASIPEPYEPEETVSQLEHVSETAEIHKENNSHIFEQEDDISFNNTHPLQESNYDDEPKPVRSKGEFRTKKEENGIMKRGSEDDILDDNFW